MCWHSVKKVHGIRIGVVHWKTAFFMFDGDLLLESKSDEAQKQIETAPGDIELDLLDNNHLLMPQKGFVYKYLYVTGPNLLLIRLNALVCGLRLYCSPLLSFRDVIAFVWWTTFSHKACITDHLSCCF